MNALAPLLDLCLQTEFSSLGNTHWYSARSDNPVCKKSLTAVRVVARQAEEVLLGCNHHDDS